MFGQSRPTFGTGSASFSGFGSNPTTGFGATSTLPFGASQQTTSSSSPFGSNTATGTSSLFGQSQNAGTGLFGSSANTGFGANTFATGGRGLFGTASTASNTSGLFGNPSTSTGFNAAQNQSRPFSFGTPTTSSSVGGLFGSSTTGGSLFGSNVGQPQGTTIKYSPVTGTDTMTRQGTAQTIQTRIEVITAMKEYEAKSLEELRVEDYLNGRKGSSSGSTSFGFGQSKFGMSQPANPSSSWLSGPTQNTGGLFGQKPVETKPLFGSSSVPGTGFGVTSSSSGLFGQTNPTPFGQTTAAPTAGFSFGQSAQPKPTGFAFGSQTTAPSIFGTPSTATQSGTTFGSSFSFGQPQSTQSGGLFGNQNKPAFGAASTGTSSLFGNKPAGTGFGGFGTPSAASPFGTINTSSGGGLFGNQNKTGFSLGTTTAPAFGTGTSSFGGVGLFGSNNNQSKPGGLTFGSSSGFGTGTNTSLGFGFNQPNTGSGGLFGNTSGGGLFGTSNLNTGSSFGNTLGTGFGMSTLQPNMNSMNNNIVTNNNINNLIKALTHNPFGASSLLKSAPPPTGKADELLNSPTNTSSNSDPNKSSTSKKPLYVLPTGSGTTSKLRPIVLNHAMNGHSDFETSKSLLFSGLEDKNDSFSEDPFKPKSFPSVKKLNLKVFKSSKSSTGQSTSTSSVINENLNLNDPTPLTTPITSPSVLGTPNGYSLTHSQENSPTPDIIKGRNNIKRLNIEHKNNMNDTMADLNVAAKSSKNIINTTPGSILDQSLNESNKENVNITIFEASNVDEELEVANVSSLEPHPAGIKLTRAGYYCLPALEDLAEMIDKESRCMVENFTVGRYGYGNVCFQGVTNVANMDIDASVFIVRKEIEVYPEGVEKPIIGEGLNKPAYVTLDCVWPVDKSNHEVIKSQDRLDAMGWTEYLEKRCIKMDATFVEYRPETGSWVFKVKHFSKYGLQEENDENLPTGGTATATMESKAKEAAARPNNATLSNITNSNNTQQFVADRIQLPATCYAGTVPLFIPRNSVSQGPPALGLVSPPTSTNFPQMPLETTSASVRRKVYLDGSDFIEPASNLYEMFGEDFDADLICPLSPSAERLAVSTKAPPRAIQNLKSQLFFVDVEDEFEPSQNQKGEKRDMTELVNVTSDVLATESSSVLTMKGSTKKLLLIGSQASTENLYLSDSNLHKKSSVKERSESDLYAPMSERDEESGIVLRDVEPPQLRDPRTEYILLPSNHRLDIDIARSFTYHLSSKIPLDMSISLKGKNCIADAASFMSRSFRVGWGPGWTLVHAGHTLGSVTKFAIANDGGSSDEADDIPFLFHGSAVTSHHVEMPSKKFQKQTLAIEKVNLLKEKLPSSNLDSLLEACLQNVLECSMPLSLELDTDSSDRFSCPLIVPAEGISLLHRLAMTATHIEDSENRDRILSSAFDLCVALWGQLDFYSPEADGDSEYARAQARKEAVSQWLEEVSENLVAEETERAMSSDEEDVYLEAIFSHLTARQISEACNLAQDKGDHHMALLLAQCCLGDETPRQIMKQQLSNWAWSGLDSHVSVSRLILYTLLAGEATHEASHTKLNTCAGLDWRRALAVHMWFVCPTTSIIDEVLLKYEKAAGLHSNKDNIYCEEPKPAYLSTMPLPENYKANHDICFQLIKLFVDPSHSLESLLDPSSVTSDPMDVTYTWLIWIILQSLGYNHLPLTKVETLHSNMAAILEAYGQWHWAAFIILCIADDKRRKYQLGELLNRHLLIEGEAGKDDPFYKEKEHFLLIDLKLPEEWMHRAKAIRARTLSRAHEEAWYLIQAGDYDRAHTLIIDSIAPFAVINEDHDHLLTYLNEFSEESIQGQVVDWASGGGIYVNYLEVIQQVEDLKQSRQPTGPKVEKLRPKLLALCTRLNNLKCPSAVHRLSISEMSRMVISVLRAILGDEPDGVRVLAQQVSSLPLAHECALEELNQLTHQYLIQVAMATN